MKKIIILLASLSLLLTLAACSKPEKEEVVETSEKVTLYLIRHGETVYNVEKKAQGWSDSPLTEEGIAQAKKLKEGLSAIDFANAYTSPSGRAVDTTNLVLNERKIPVHEDENLKEMNFGSLEEQDSSRLWEQGIDETWENGWVAYGGEDFYILAERAMTSLDSIVNDPQNKGKNVLVSSHGMTILSILYEVDYQAADSLEEGLDNCSVTIIEYENGEYKLITLNDTSYLK